MAITVDGKRYRTIDKGGFNQAIGEYWKTVKTPEGERTVVGGRGSWRFWTPADRVAPLRRAATSVPFTWDEAARNMADRIKQVFSTDSVAFSHPGDPTFGDHHFMTVERTCILQYLRASKTMEARVVSLVDMTSTEHVPDAFLTDGVTGSELTFHEAMQHVVSQLKTHTQQAPSIRRAIPNKARCASCDTIVESRHRHDFVRCECGSFALDGGLDYWRVVGDDIGDVIRLDWNDEPLETAE